MERTEENNATKDRFAHVGKIFSEMDSEKPQAEIAERSKIIKPKSVIRISLCRTAKRNPLIFPI